MQVMTPRVRTRAMMAAAVSLLLLGPAVVSGQARDWPSQSPPRPLPARDVSFPPYELRTLSNGLEVMVVMHHEQPAVSLRLLVRAGSRLDPPGRQGTAALVASLLDEGTTSLDARQIADRIDSAGGILDSGAGRDLSHVHVVVLEDTLDVGMQLLADVVRNPSFPEAEVERQRQQLLAALRVGEEDPAYMADVAFDRLVYGFHPYGFPTNGTTASAGLVTRDDIASFHRAWYAPNNSILAIVGDVTVDESMAAVEKAFGDWQRRELAALVPPEPPAPTRRVVIIDKPDAVQTEIRVGHLGVPRKSRDFTAFDVATKILGGEGSNRLHRVLRSERGLTYGAEARLDAFEQAGAIRATTNTRPETTGEALRVIVDEFYRIRREPVYERELADAKAYLTGHFPLTIETPQEIAMQVLNVLFYGLPVDEIETYRDRINAIEVDTIARVVRDYMKPDRLSVVLLGNASAFLDQLRRVGFENYEVIPLGSLDLTRPDLRKPESDGSPQGRFEARVIPVSHVPQRGSGAAVRFRPSADEAAGELLRMAVAAKGGLDRLAAVRTLVARSVVTTSTPGGGPTAALSTTYIEYPARFRVDLELSSNTVVQTYADGEAWALDAFGVHDLPAAVRDGLRTSVERDVLLLLVRAATGQIRVRVGDPDGRGTSAGTSSSLRFDLPDGEVVLDVDRSSGLVLRQRYTEIGSMGSQAVEESYSDYRSVEGIEVAFTAIRRAGSTVLERKLTALTINAPMDSGLFARPHK
ncbi:MAG: M16 family metallopeptidase [Vicinamibacterales bacterium]